MKLLEFITFCELKGLVQEKYKLREGYTDTADGDCYRISIFSEGADHRLSMVYALQGDKCVMVSNSLFIMHGHTNTAYRSNILISEIVQEFFPDEAA